jgi:GntR family transcriptional regulator/MocR family aminotransferase
MKILATLISLDKESAIPVYLQISNCFIHSIRQGKLRRGLKLSGSRAVAAMLNINRMTMVAAYDELEAQGWIEKISRKGTFVKHHLPLLTPEKIRPENKRLSKTSRPSFKYNEGKFIPIESSDFPAPDKLYFNDGFPDPRLAPADELARRMRSLSRLSANKKYLMYGGAQGTQFLRDTLAKYLNDTRGLSTTKDNILITRGAQMGIYIAASLLLNPGDAVITGQPGYNGANLTFQQLGARIHFVNVDEGGLDVSGVEKICKKRDIKMVYVIPHHHNPTTVTLTTERRVGLLELAAKYKFAIIEDDYDYDFHYSSKPIMPMASIDTKGSVIYIGTMTKTLTPSIRFGFMVAPEAFVNTATMLRKSIDTQGDSLMENALASMFEDGTMTRHIKKSVKLYHERRDHFCKLLAIELGNKVLFKIPDGGMSVWVNFLTTDVKNVAAQARVNGLVMSDGTDYDTNKTRYNSIRIGFASLNYAEQQKAVSILKKIMLGKK